jgi:predicted TIM-barrel fold metal-dependent hydrolase
MALDAIERAAVYPTYGLMIQGVTEREPALALCRVVNDWLADYCRAAPDRLLGIGTLPMVDPADAALAEARRCIEQLGMRGVWRRPEFFAGIARLHDPGHEALFAHLAEAGVPLAIHPGLNGVVPAAFYEERFEADYAAMHAAHFPVEQLMSLTEVIAFGILERHPGLRMAFLESGATWALAHLHRLDEHAEKFGFARANLRLRPSEYFRRQCFVAVEEAEPGLDSLLRAYPESVVFASDYPHGDCTFPGSPKALLETPELDSGARRSILRGNAERLYGPGSP